jgi:NAD(P)-dependent dehydrogenase (short-subunit alcohol dehydrogenase family)
MKRQSSGRIVNQSSASAYATIPRPLHYSMTKAAVITMTKTLARELGPFGITVNAIGPGVIDTEATRMVGPADVLSKGVEATSLRRIGHPGDLAPVVGFLCSDQLHHRADDHRRRRHYHARLRRVPGSCGCVPGGRGHRRVTIS